MGDPEMNAPQIIMIALLAMTWAVALAKDGESKGKYSIGLTSVAILAEVALLWWGGFFG
jgi:hypothetical protein